MVKKNRNEIKSAFGGEDIKIYTAKSIYQAGLLGVFKGMVKNIYESRELIWQLFLREFKSRYKQSLLGWAWIFLMPIVTMGTFLLLNISGVIKIGEIPVPYPIFGLLGFSLWQIFANGWSALTISVAGSGTLIRQINFPRETLVIASMGHIIIDFFIRFSLVLIVYLIYGLKPSFLTILMPIYCLPLIFLTLGLGFLSSILNSVVKDTKNFIEVGMSFFLFLMPIMYTIPEKGFLAKFNKFNPIFFLVNTPRNIIISGRIDFLFEFILSAVIAVVVFIIGWIAFYVAQPKLAERI